MAERQPAERPAGVHSLPDELLAACLRPLELKDRHSGAALVCKRWAAVVNSPQLLQSLSLSLGSGYASYNQDQAAVRAGRLLRGRSLLHWMLRRCSAAAVQQLHLQLQLDGFRNGTDAEQAEMWGLAHGCLAACAPQLHSLKFSPTSLLNQLCDVQPWYLHMQQLHTLELQSDMRLRILVSLVSLGSLRSLSTRVPYNHLLIGPGVALPSALTQLSLKADTVQGAFSQVPLGSLRSLCLRHGTEAAVGGLPAFSSMTHLASLGLEYHELPTGISFPSSLKSLAVTLCSLRSSDAEVYAVLRQLTGLTGLALYETNEVPPFLTALRQLRQLYLQVADFDCDGALPAGGWMGSLQRLAVDAGVAVASVANLAQATRLSHLILNSQLRKFEAPELLQGWLDVWQFAASHPPLRTFEFPGTNFPEDHPDMVTVDTLHACLRLAAKRPSVRIVVQPEILCWPLDELLAVPSVDDV